MLSSEMRAYHTSGATRISGLRARGDIGVSTKRSARRHEAIFSTFGGGPTELQFQIDRFDFKSTFLLFGLITFVVSGFVVAVWMLEGWI